MIPGRGWIGLLIAALAACNRDPAPAADSQPPVPQGGRGRVVFVGTSLTAGFGLDPSEAYPALLQRRIDSAGLPFTVINAGVSGETSAGARRRIEWLLREPAAVLVIETGANDGLRGLDVDSLEANLQAIIDRSRRQKPPPRIVLISMEAPPNYGLRYVRRFRAVYPEVARRTGAALVPFLLQGVAGVDSLNQADMLHPTAAGQRRIAETVWPVLERELRASERAARRTRQELPQGAHGGIDLPRGVVVVRRDSDRRVRPLLVHVDDRVLPLGRAGVDPARAKRLLEVHRRVAGRLGGDEGTHLPP
jgi:acyl-CoA thioesterase-1